MFQPRLRAVATTERTEAKSQAASKVQKAPEIFDLDLHHAQGLFSQVVGEGDGEVDKEAQDVVFELV